MEVWINFKFIISEEVSYKFINFSVSLWINECIYMEKQKNFEQVKNKLNTERRKKLSITSWGIKTELNQKNI